MDRNTRTLVVVGVAVAAAALASFGVYQAIQRMPVREVEVRSLHHVVAVADMPMGSLVTKDQVKLVAWPASEPGCRTGSPTIEQRRQPRPDRRRRRQRAADRDQAGAARGGRRPAAVHSRGHARVVGEGERGGRRRRLRRAGHPRRRAGHAAPGAEPRQHDARRRQQRPGADRRHPLRPGEGARRPADSDVGRDAAGHAGGRRDGRARRERRRRSC